MKRMIAFVFSLMMLAIVASAACPVANGTYHLENLYGNGSYATADNNTAGTQMFLETYSPGSTHQQYVLTNTLTVGTSCYYTIKNVGSNLYLENVSGQFVQEAANGQDNQLWLVQQAPFGGTAVTITSRSDGKKVEVKDASGIAYSSWLFW